MLRKLKSENVKLQIEGKGCVYIYRCVKHIPGSFEHLTASCFATTHQSALCRIAEGLLI